MSHFDANAARARRYFPRGLFQPKKSFRFSLDALLLAAYATRLRPDWRRMADLGCGCGPVAFGALILAGETNGREVLGLDAQDELIGAAHKNALTLGFEDVFKVARADFTVYKPEGYTGCFDLVTANPPYRLPGEGRLPPSLMRRMALFGDRDNLHAFVRAGRALLAPGGIFCLIFPAGRADELEALLGAERLELYAALPVHAGHGGGLTLMAAREKNSENNILAWREQKPLVIYNSLSGYENTLSAEALGFCRFLSCNTDNIEG